jgi:hypothetical protein
MKAQRLLQGLHDVERPRLHGRAIAHDRKRQSMRDQYRTGRLRERLAAGRGL